MKNLVILIWCYKYYYYYINLVKLEMILFSNKVKIIYNLGWREMDICCEGPYLQMYLDLGVGNPTFGSDIRLSKIFMVDPYRRTSP